jgi:two-component system, cell cycle response regulator
MPWLSQLDAGGNVSKSWELGHEPVVFGRGDDAQVKIDDDEMSRRHFEIKFLNDTHVLTDLNSSNGTWHNGRRVSHAYLKTSDQVAAGKTRFVYQVGTSTMLGFVENAYGTTFKDELKQIYSGAKKTRNT